MDRPKLEDYKNDVGYKYRDYIKDSDKYIDKLEQALDKVLTFYIKKMIDTSCDSCIFENYNYPCEYICMHKEKMKEKMKEWSLQDDN